MIGDTRSNIVRADMSAFEFSEAAWAAGDRDLDRGRRMPDPSELSDRALSIVMRYHDRDLPSESHAAVEAEWRRRVLSPRAIRDTIGLALMALVAGGGIVIAWMIPSG